MSDVPSFSVRTTWLSKSLSYSVRATMTRILCRKRRRRRQKSDDHYRTEPTRLSARNHPFASEESEDRVAKIWQRRIESRRLRRAKPCVLALCELARGRDPAR